MHVYQLHVYRALRGAELHPQQLQLNVKMQITFTSSEEDFHLLVALVTVHPVVTHQSHASSNNNTVACNTSQI